MSNEKLSSSSMKMLLQLPSFLKSCWIVKIFIFSLFESDVFLALFKIYFFLLQSTIFYLNAIIIFLAITLSLYFFHLDLYLYSSISFYISLYVLILLSAYTFSISFSFYFLMHIKIWWLEDEKFSLKIVGKKS
jgi:hypothetical protein